MKRHPLRLRMAKAASITNLFQRAQLLLAPLHELIHHVAGKALALDHLRINAHPRQNLDLALRGRFFVPPRRRLPGLQVIITKQQRQLSELFLICTARASLAQLLSQPQTTLFFQLLNRFRNRCAFRLHNLFEASRVVIGLGRQISRR